MPLASLPNTNPQWAYSWNAPRPAVCLFTQEEEEKPADESGLSPLLKKHLEKLRQNNEPLSSIALTQIKRIAEQERAAYRSTLDDWHKTPAGVAACLERQPYFIRQAFASKIDWLKKNRGQQPVNAFLMGSVRKALTRLNIVRERQAVRDGHCAEVAVYYARRWPKLAEFDKRSVINAAHDIAGKLAEMIESECVSMNCTLADLTDAELLFLYRHVGAEAFALRVAPPDWRAINAQFDRIRCYSSLLRMTNPDWWGHKLWRLRCEWRENQLRAAGVIHRRAQPYVSRDALTAWMEQRRKNAEFFRAHELVDEEGNTASLEAMVNASVSNRAIRRHELMTRMAGVELVAQSRGDVGVFLTITCPSKYHGNISSGHQNPKWNHTAPAAAQRYLCKTWQRATSALKRRELRPYGFRVAEPHHDATPHWHVLLFMPQPQMKETVAILRKYFIQEDREELGRRTGARFKSKKMDPSKGSATAYVAKYISKNIDGYALEGELDTETGCSLKETARFAMAWASLHNIRQFQSFGQPSVTVWRELRKLNNQLVYAKKEAGEYKPGDALLGDPAMDAVLASADAGCFASYIEKQGGVLIARELYRVRLAYEEADEVNAYGEATNKIWGVYSPYSGLRACTRLTKWKIRAKQVEPNANAQAVDLSPATAGPWSTVNNSTVAEKIANFSPPKEEIDSPLAPDVEGEEVGFDEMDDKQRRALLRRLRKFPPPRAKHDRSSIMQPPKNAPYNVPRSTLLAIQASAAALGVDIPDAQAVSLACGARLLLDGRKYYAVGGLLLEERDDPRRRGTALLRGIQERHGVNTDAIVFDPFGSYRRVLNGEALPARAEHANYPGIVGYCREILRDMQVRLLMGQGMKINFRNAISHS